MGGCGVGGGGLGKGALAVTPADAERGPGSLTAEVSLTNEVISGSPSKMILLPGLLLSGPQP